MARPLRVQYPGAIYRISHQGRDWQHIFRGNDDKISFLDSLESRRVIVIDFLYRHCHMTNPAVDDLVNLHYSTVSSLRKRLISLRQSDKLPDGEVLIIERSLTRSPGN